MQNAKFNTVIWDLDGTLADSVGDIANAVNLVLEEFELAELPLSEIRLMVGNGAGKLLDRAFARAEGLQVYSSEKAYQRFVLHYSRQSCEHTVLYPGIRSVLHELFEAGVSQGVCTNKPHALSVDILHQLNINHYFGSVIGGDSTAHRKPHALPLQTCIRKLGAEHSSTLLIGDSAADVGAAQNIGIRVAVVPWGYSRMPALELGGDYLVSSAEEIMQLLLSRA